MGHDHCIQKHVKWIIRCDKAAMIEQNATLADGTAADGIGKPLYNTVKWLRPKPKAPMGAHLASLGGAPAADGFEEADNCNALLNRLTDGVTRTLSDHVANDRRRLLDDRTPFLE